ncbi:Alpha-galactosidase [Psidium guajava]|nr:Alpha-galactosidase [Psidium guajava]
MGQPVNAAAPSTAAPAGDGMMTDDQCFLLTVVLGTYFGPHLQGEGRPTSWQCREHMNQSEDPRPIIPEASHAFGYPTHQAGQTNYMNKGLNIGYDS